MIRQKKRVDFEFLRNLPEELRKNVKRKLCLEFLKKVDEFRSCEQLLEELCDCVKLVSHDQHTVIVQKGRSIDHMLFLVQGELQTYSLTSVDSAGSTANPPSNLPISIERLEKGEFYGKELVDLFQADLNPSNLPISTRTIQTITKVDAFALMSYDLQNVFIKHRTQVQAPLPADSQPQAPPPPAEPPVFGGLWYFFATVRVIDCWTKAGKKYALKFRKDAFVCRGTLRDYNFLNEFCSAKTQNRAIYDFGIYRDALESGIVETTNLPKKILYCFRWGLQNLSAFGQSLQSSTDTWENIFVLSITIYSMALFVFFIGNVQVYLQSKTIKSEMIRQKKQQIEQCTSFAKLSENLKKKIKRYQPDVWEETKGVDFEFLFNLPEDLRKDMKRELCLELLKKVDEFKDWSEKLLEELCDCVKPVSYAQQTLIVQKDSPIDKMLFLVQGELQTYSLTSVDRLKKGEFCGKELVDCFRADLYPSNLPISTRTIQTITKVDAFALMSYDLQNVFIKHRTQVQAPLPPAEPPAQQCCNCWGKC
ncbi:hypothetical protein LWI29_026750 [Acer saccharum]|uniref:Cyclic nucleotide-binding domain-containing protein n=1 Tax=Acer saccharum TaxID=4024 RepID=A0AA39ST45_ACESA|nr:hypothetical protein LWI29_026750 [Acer saccharum]